MRTACPGERGQHVEFARCRAAQRTTCLLELFHRHRRCEIQRASCASVNRDIQRTGDTDRRPISRAEPVSVSAAGPSVSYRITTRRAELRRAPIAGRGRRKSRVRRQAHVAVEIERRYPAPVRRYVLKTKEHHPLTVTGKVDLRRSHCKKLQPVRGIRRTRVAADKVLRRTVIRKSPDYGKVRDPVGVTGIVCIHAKVISSGQLRADIDAKPAVVVNAVTKEAVCPIRLTKRDAGQRVERDLISLNHREATDEVVRRTGVKRHTGAAVGRG